jgi:hypothetical protein
MASDKFIAGAIKHPGALHSQLGVPQGQKIPEAKLEHAAHAGGKLGQRARFAMTLKGLHHHGPHHEMHHHSGEMHVHHHGGNLHIHHADGHIETHSAPHLEHEVEMPGAEGSAEAATPPAGKSSKPQPKVGPKVHSMEDLKAYAKKAHGV